MGECYGVIYELLNAEDLLNVVQNDKVHIEDHIKNYAIKMRSMHQIQVDDRFDDTKEGTINCLRYLEGKVCTADEVKKLQASIANVPDRNTFIQGDAHIGNVMLQNGEYMFIDLSTASKGHPIFDMVSMYSGFKMAQHLSDEEKEARELTKGFTTEEMKRIWNTYITTYLDTDDEEFIAKAEEQIGVITCARVILAAIAIPGMFTQQKLEYFKGTSKNCA